MKVQAFCSISGDKRLKCDSVVNHLQVGELYNTFSGLTVG